VRSKVPGLGRYVYTYAVKWSANRRCKAAANQSVLAAGSRESSSWWLVVGGDVVDWLDDGGDLEWS
jgi:hypothetical protein